MRPKARPRFDPACLPVYGRLMDTRPTPKAGDTCMLNGRPVYVLAVDGDLAKVHFIHVEQRTATCHLDLLEVAHA